MTSQASFGAGSDSAMTGWPTELRLVVSCLRAGLGLGHGGGDTLDQVAASRSDDPEPNWQRFLDCVARHHVTPLVYAGLQTAVTPRFPDGVRAQLRDRTHVNAVRMLTLGCELVRLLRVFDEHGIPSLPMKGPALAVQVHGYVTKREVQDLDLLVRPGDLVLASDVLRSQGYQPDFSDLDGLTGKLRRIYMNHTNQLRFVHSKTRIIVELHWRALSEVWPAQLDDLVGRAEHVRLAGRDIPVFGRDDLLIHLAAHGAMHAWRRFSWLAEFARLIPRTSDEVWGRVWASASRAGVERPLAQGLLVSQQLFDTPIPEPVGRSITGDRPVRALAKYARWSMLHETYRLTPVRTDFRTLAYRARLRKSIRYRLRNFHSVIFSVHDLHQTVLPDRLVWLYYPLRPILWIKRRWRARPATAARPRDTPRT